MTKHFLPGLLSFLFAAGCTAAAGEQATSEDARVTAAFASADSLGMNIAGRLIHEVYRVLPGGGPSRANTASAPVAPERVALAAR